MRSMLSCLGLRGEMARRHKDYQAKLDQARLEGTGGHVVTYTQIRQTT